MKPTHLFTSLLALTTIVVTSCSAPRLAQQRTAVDDDVYNSTAQAQVYTPQQRSQAQSTQNDYDQNDEYYGASDPYYDMDYSSRINRFYNYSPWRSYYDPYFDNGFGYNGFSLGLSFGSIWNSPYYGWGNYYSPFYGYNNPWGWNNFYGGGFYGGGYYGGGYYGGGFYGGGYYGGGYYGGGTYTGRTTNAPRPPMGGESGRNNGGIYNVRTGTGRADANGVITRGTRSQMYNPNGNSASDTRASRADIYRQDAQGNRPARVDRSDVNNRPQPQSRPTRTESYRPEPQSRPTYSPPPSRSEGGGGGGGGGRSSGGGGGGGGSSRGGRG